VIAAITMTVGNVTALSQTSLKRLLGYSSIAHAGYILLGLVALGGLSGDARSLALGALLFYILVYGLTNLAAFGAVQAAEEGLGSDEISGLAGLSRRSGPLALVLSAAMLSLTGIPPFIGFFAKIFIFVVVVQAGYAWLVVIAVANSALSAVYYMRVVRSIYFEEGRSARPFEVGAPMWTALGFGSVAILPLAIFVSRFVDIAQQGARAVFLR
jgi:NADH-quinone oxidoreductase subunit N